MTPDQAFPVHCPMPHHAAMERKSSTIPAAYPAPPSIPAPAPARVADCRSSALASASSWRMRVERSALIALNSSPIDRSSGSTPKEVVSCRGPVAVIVHLPGRAR
jgi:hypothetical protein